MKSYWKRLSCGYIDATGRRMDNGTELDVRGVRSYPQQKAHQKLSFQLMNGFLPT